MDQWTNLINGIAELSERTLQVESFCLLVLVVMILSFLLFSSLLFFFFLCFSLFVVVVVVFSLRCFTPVARGGGMESFWGSDYHHRPPWLRCNTKACDWSSMWALGVVYRTRVDSSTCSSTSPRVRIAIPEHTCTYTCTRIAYCLPCCHAS